MNPLLAAAAASWLAITAVLIATRPRPRPVDRHAACLRHIAEMERELGIGPPPEESAASRLVKQVWEKEVARAMRPTVTGGAGTPPGVSGGGGTFSGRWYLATHPLTQQQCEMYGIPPEIVAKY